MNVANFIIQRLVRAAALMLVVFTVPNAFAQGTPVNLNTLATYGITISNVTPGSSIVIENDPCCNPQTVMEETNPSLGVVSYTLNFNPPLTDLKFSRAAITLGTPVEPSWTATIYAGSTVVGSVGEGFLYLPAPSPSANFDFPAPGITSMVVNSNNGHFAAFTSAVLDNFIITRTLSCQVTPPVARLGQCDITQAPAHWGKESYANSTQSMCALGCATTSLSRALAFQGINGFPINSVPFDNDPGYLNEFMVVNTPIPGDYAGQIFSAFDVNWDVTTRSVGGVLTPPQPTLHFDLSYFGDPNYPDALEDVVCRENKPVIVGVTSRITHVFNRHNVLVTGVEPVTTSSGGTCSAYTDLSGACVDFLIADPYGDPTSADSSKVPYTTLSQYGSFMIKGWVTDPPGDVSGLDLSVSENANPLLTDSSGNRTGFDASTGLVAQEIPKSGYLPEVVDNDEVIGPGTSTSYLINVFQPSPGAYTVTLNGVKPGPYSLGINSFSQDGSAQPVLSTPGIAVPGSTSSFQIQFASGLGAASTIARVATFESTLADIGNSLQLGLIDNAGIANALSAKISAASDAASGGDSTAGSNILNAFKNQVAAQTGHHITDVAPRVLQEDADSLISQLTIKAR